jgi:hypothetical protein
MKPVIARNSSTVIAAGPIVVSFECDGAGGALCDRL